MQSTVIIGLGYVGLPLANLCVEKGIKTIGVDINKSKINALRTKKLSIDGNFASDDIILTTDFKLIRDVKVVVVCVPTPVDSNNMPDLNILKSAVKSISENIRKGHLIIIESTVSPGVCGEIVKPTSEESGLKCGKDFYLAHCPERINPGDKKWNISNIPRVVGANSKEGVKKALQFYESIIEAEITPMSSLKVAEAVKIVENSFRDVNIAFVNELAKSFSIFGIDILEVIDAASTKPFGFLAHYPSCGVGGHCIPIDPYYLIQKAKENGFDHNFLKLAREINESMPSYTVSLLVEGLNKIGLPVKSTKICVLGISYKANVSDVRHSPAFQIIKGIKKLGGDVKVYDPYVPDKSDFNSLDESLDWAQALVIATNHDEFIKMNIPKNVLVVIDGKNCLTKNKIECLYKGIGRE